MWPIGEVIHSEFSFYLKKKKSQIFRLSLQRNDPKKSIKQCAEKETLANIHKEGKKNTCIPFNRLNK